MFNEVFGATREGQQYLHISIGTEECWIAKREASSVGGLDTALRQRGLMGTPADLKVLLQRIREVVDFPPTDIAGHPGWHDDIAYMHRNGDASVPKGHPKPQVGFARSASVSLAGTPLTWKNRVVAPLSNWPAGMFVVALPFLGPLLRLMPLVPNATIELVGGVGTGKAALRDIAASVSGGTGANGSQRCWVSTEAAMDKLNELVLDHRDRVLMLDGTHILLHIFDPKKLARQYVTLAFNVPRGDIVMNGVTDSGSGYRGVVMLIGRESLRSVTGKDDQSRDKLISLPIASDWEVPAGYLDKAAYFEALRTAAAANHGHPYRRYIDKLVARLAADREGLQRQLQGWQDEFLELADPDRSSGEDLDKARVFAAVFAAGRLAMDLNTLPEITHFGAAIEQCYELYRAQNALRLPFADRLEALAADERVVKVSSQKDDRQSQRASQALGTLVSLPTHRELRVPPANIGRAFNDWKAIWKTDEVRGLMVPADGRGLQPKVSLAPGLPAKRHWCFKLPLQAPGLFDADNSWEDSE